MKQKTGRKLLSFLLTLAMLVGLMPGMGLTALAVGTTWNTNNSLPTTAGNYMLDTDVTISGTWNVPTGETTIDLNGHGIKYTGNTGSVFKVPSGAVLNLKDSENTEHKFTYTPLVSGLDAGLATVNDSASENYQTFTGGYITGGKGSVDSQSSNNFRWGGAVMIDGGTFNMYGGTLIGNSVGNGGGAVYMIANSGATFNMYDGKIMYNKAQHGGAIRINSNTMTMYGGEISHNACTDDGGGIHASSGTFTMTGGKIEKNVAGHSGSGVHQGNLTISGTAEIRDNVISSNKAGAGIFKPNSLSISGNPTITGNKLQGGNDSNVYLANDKKITIPDELTYSTPIGVSMQTPGVFTDSSNMAYNDDSKFISDNEQYAVGKNAEGQLFLETLIISVAVTDIEAPVATETLDTEATTSTSNVSLGKVTWEPTTTPAAYATEYTATVIATAAEGCAFTDNATATVNGETATVTKNADGTLSISYKFSKTALTPVTITATDKKVDWSADGIAIPVEGMFTITKGAGAATYTVENVTGEGTFAEDKLTVTKCGTFTVKASTAATETYAAGAETSATLIVNKIAPTVTAPTAKTGLVYTGKAQELVNAGSTNDGTLYYAVTTENKAPTDNSLYGTSIPTATNAGTYYVWYKVVGDANHNDSGEKCVTVTIAPVDKTLLKNAIKEAEDYYNTIKDNADYSKQAEALSKAINTAKELAKDNNAKDDDVSAGITAVTDAKKKAEAEVKDIDDTSVANAVSEKINALPASDKVATTDKAAIEAARKAYDALTEDQKKKVSADTLKKLEGAEKALEKANNKAAFEEEKTTQKNAVDALAEAGDSDASKKLITDAKAAIDGIAYDESKTLADNKAAIGAITTKLKTDLTAQRAADKKDNGLEAAKKEAQAAMNEQVTVTQKGKKIIVKWKKSTSADGYDVYVQYCGKKATKPAVTIEKNTTTNASITKINNNKLDLKKQFKVYVEAYKMVDGEKVVLGKSNVGHIVGVKNSKYTNVKSIKLTKSKYTVKVGKTAKIKAKIALVDKSKKHISTAHGAKFRYKSSDTSIATVDKNGKIKGISKGTCTIYVYAINGKMKKAKVTVK